MISYLRSPNGLRPPLTVTVSVVTVAVSVSPGSSVGSPVACWMVRVCCLGSIVLLSLWSYLSGADLMGGGWCSPRGAIEAIIPWIREFLGIAIDTILPNTRIVSSDIVSLTHYPILKELWL